MTSYIIAFNDSEIIRPDIRGKGYDIVRVEARRAEPSDRDKLKVNDFLKVFGRKPQMSLFEIGLYYSWIDALTRAVNANHNEPFIIGESDLYARVSSDEVETLLYESGADILRPWLTYEVSNEEKLPYEGLMCTCPATPVLQYVMAAYAKHMSMEEALCAIYNMFRCPLENIDTPLEQVLWGTHGLVFRSSEAAKPLLKCMQSTVLPTDNLLVYASVIGDISMAVTSSNLFIQIPRDRSKDVYDRYV